MIYKDEDQEVFQLAARILELRAAMSGLGSNNTARPANKEDIDADNIPKNQYAHGR